MPNPIQVTASIKNKNWLQGDFLNMTPCKRARVSFLPSASKMWLFACVFPRVGDGFSIFKPLGGGGYFFLFYIIRCRKEWATRFRCRYSPWIFFPEATVKKVAGKNSKNWKSKILKKSDVFWEIWVCQSFSHAKKPLSELSEAVAPESGFWKI